MSTKQDLDAQAKMIAWGKIVLEYDAAYKAAGTPLSWTLAHELKVAGIERRMARLRGPFQTAMSAMAVRQAKLVDN
jgi:hypothetical protein